MQGGIFTKFGVKRIFATVIGALVFFIIARYASIFVYVETYISFQYAILSSFAAVFGPVCGLLIGFVGHGLTDLSFYSSIESIWWSWVIASALAGFMAGFVLKPGKIENGEFTRREIIRFVVGNLVIHVISWGVVAPILDIAIYDESASKAFLQGLIAGTSNFIITAVVGSLLLIGYVNARISLIDTK